MTKFLFKIGIVLVALITLIFLGQIVFEASFNFPQKINYGVTFSPTYAKYLGLDWKKTYLSVLDELKVKQLRLPSYWDEIEKVQGELSFEDEDFMLDEAGRIGAKAILVVGIRQPRWPECHIPSWAKALSFDQKRTKILRLIQNVVERYKGNEALEAIQVENEPFLPYFGENCDKGDENFLRTEVNLVRSLTSKPIVVSDSGELGNWIVPMQTSDIFGTTLYRDVYNPILGYIRYPILPYLYNLKSQIVRKIFAPQNQKTIIIELQAEPWLNGKDKDLAHLFPVEKMKDYINYAQKTGFDTQYLWGVEWWYWMAQNGYPQYLEYAKTLFK